MFVHYARWYVGAAWILLVVLTPLAADVLSAGSVLLLAIGAIVPPFVMLALRPGGPPLTIAEVLHGWRRIVSAPTAADVRWAVPANPLRRDSPDSGHPQRRAAGHARHAIGALLGDGVMLLLVILLFPLAILLLGMPVALLVRILLEIAARM